jgi:ubiquitin carboxyl-terminal hydrolase 44/49
VRERPRSTLVPGETGIRNLGNTCYMNAVLQCLSNTPAFRQFFLSELDQTAFNVPKTKLQRIDTATCLATMLDSEATKAMSKNGGHTVATQLYALLRVLWSGKWSVVTPHSLIEEVWRAMPKYRNHLQHDAQEFLGDIMELLERELRGAGTLCPDPAAHAIAKGASATATRSIAVPKGKKRATTTTAAAAAAPLPTHLACLFRGVMRSDVVCQRCKRVSSTEEPFWQLTLDLPRDASAGAARRSARMVSPRRAPEQARSTVSCTLRDCFEAFSAPETVPQYACDHCPSRQTAIKSLHVVEMPQVLVVVLKRFRWDGNGTKIDTTVSFDLDDIDFNGTNYELTGVVVHHGRTLRSGHYTAYLRHSDRWFHANDNKINSVSEDVVLSQSSQVYLMFLERVDKVARRRLRTVASDDDDDDDSDSDS